MPDAVGYLVSQYPALSHTFIEREIAALRDLGVRVETFSVRPADPEAPFPDATRAEVVRTQVLQGRPLLTDVAGVLATAVRSPAAFAAGLRIALSAGPLTARAKLWQLFYLAEAVRLERLMTAARVHLLHVHHANNAADIARIAVAIGGRRHRGGPEWRWSLAMHGPTEFLDPAGHDLPAKLASASRVACISDYAQRTALALAPLADPARFGIVRMSAPAAAYPPVERIRPSGPLSVLFVGRLVPEKAPDVLIDAVALLRERGLDIELVLAGDGPLRASLEELVERTGLARVVRIVGPVGQHELPAYYGRADVFCLPSHAEGIPVVLMEAMLTELPVVTTAVAGIPELVGADTGVLVEPGDAVALADAIEALAATPVHRRALGRRGRDVVLERHAAPENARRLRDLLLG